MNEGHSAFLALERIRVLMSRTAVELRRSARSGAHQQRLHHAHLGARRASTCSTPGMMYEYFQDYCQRAADSPSTSCWRWAAAIRATRRNRFRWPSRRSRPRLTATPSAACIATFRNRCGRSCGPTCRCGRCPSPPSPTACICPPGSTAIWPASTISTCEPDWREGQCRAAKSGSTIAEIPDAELWEAHRRRKRRLVAFVRERAVASAVERNAPGVGGQAPAGSAGSGGADHRIRAALRHL